MQCSQYQPPKVLSLDLDFKEQKWKAPNIMTCLFPKTISYLSKPTTQEAVLAEFLLGKLSSSKLHSSQFQPFQNLKTQSIMMVNKKFLKEKVDTILVFFREPLPL